jgi:hypothetical protein
MDKYHGFRDCRLKMESLTTKISLEYDHIYSICDSTYGTESMFNAAIQVMTALSEHLYYLEQMEDKNEPNTSITK